MRQAIRIVPAATLVALLVAVSGCATRPPTSEERAAVWLTKQPRTLRLHVERELPQPEVRSRDYRAGERAREGAKTGAGFAASSIGMYCVGIPVAGCVLGLVLSPVYFVGGAVVGAASVKSVDHLHPIESVRGGAALFTRGGRAVDMPRALAEDVLAESKGSHHHLVYDEGKGTGGAKDSGTDGELRLSFESIELFGDLGEDPSVALLVGVTADLNTRQSASFRLGEFTYQSPAHYVSGWRADDARLFRQEVDKAVHDIAAQIAARLDSSASLMAALRVANARSRERGFVRTARVAPSPGGLAAPTSPASESSANGLLAGGTWWTYELSDGIYGGEKSRIKVRVASADDRFVREVVSATGGTKQPAVMSRTISVRDASFDLYPLDADRTLTEFAPYLLAAEGEDGLKSIAEAKGYPTAGESDWVTRSAPPVWEQVTVPAGTFRALRLELRGRRRIPPFSSISVQRFEIRVWYAPAVKRYARLEHRSWISLRRPYTYDVVELIEYHPPTRNVPRGG